MLITVKTFDGHTLNDTDYQAVLLNPHGSTSANPVFIDQSQADAVDAGTYTVDKRPLTLNIKVRDYADRHALIAQLKTWFKRGTRGTLVATFSDDATDYQLDCRVTSFVPNPDFANHFTVLLETGNSAWRAVTATTETTWVVTGTSETQTIAVGGKDETLLNLSLTAAGGPATGYLYQRLYQLPNTLNVEHGLIPWCITLDTAALVTAGKMQADCDDLRVVDLNTGQELKRWIDTPNNASTKVWINLNLKKGFSLTLLTAVASSGTPAYLQFAVTTDMKTRISQMPKSGIVYHGNEWFAYTNTDVVNCRLTLSTRALFGTTMEAHAGGVTFAYIQYPLLIKYGNSAVASPASTDASYDIDKPLINLNSSTNTSWVWDSTTKFYDPDNPNRTGGWIFGAKALGPNSKTFNIKQDAASGDPALGFKVVSYIIGSVWKPETFDLHATIYRACGFTSVSMTGDKYRSNANWPTIAALYRITAQNAYVQLWNETLPATAATWTAWTHNSVSVATYTPRLGIYFYGGYPGAANAYAVFEALTCTAVADSNYVPTGTLLSETNAYPLSLVLENITDAVYSDALILSYMMLINKTFVIDGEQKTATYDGVNAHSAIALDDESRSAFIRLKGNATNTIQISGADLGTLNVVMSYYRRRL
jgi:hypothetical protein